MLGLLVVSYNTFFINNYFHDQKTKAHQLITYLGNHQRIILLL